MYDGELSPTTPPPQFPSIFQEWLEKRVYVGGFVRESDVERGECTQVFELARVEVCAYDGGFGLDLEKFLEQAEEVRGSL